VKTIEGFGPAAFAALLLVDDGFEKVPWCLNEFKKKRWDKNDP
jgi:hypothetical protein